MSSAFKSALGTRIDWSPSTAWLALGDGLVIVAFLVVGELRHDVNPVAQPGHVAITIAPFLLGWLIAAPLVGAYSERARRSVPASVVFAIVSWLVADLIGAALRATPVIPGNSPVTFVAVTFGVGGVSLAIWRAVATWYTTR